MSIPFPEPTAVAGSPTEVFERYLGFFRSRLAAKLRELPEGELRRSRLPSGWTPLELLKHVTFVEMRWLEWGFEGRSVPDPWGDQRDDRWHVAPEESLGDLLAALDAQARRSDAVIAAHDLDEVGQPGERWGGAARDLGARAVPPAAGVCPPPRPPGHRLRARGRRYRQMSRARHPEPARRRPTALAHSPIQTAACRRATAPTRAASARPPERHHHLLLRGILTAKIVPSAGH